MGQMKDFLNAPQLNFFYNAQVCPLTCTHSCNWPAIEEKYIRITESEILPLTQNVHSVPLHEKWIAVFNNISCDNAWMFQSLKI